MQSSMLLYNSCWFPKGPVCLTTIKSILPNAIFHSDALPPLQPSCSPSKTHLPVGSAWHTPRGHVSALRAEEGHTSLCPQSRTETPPPRERAAPGSVGHRSIKGFSHFYEKCFINKVLVHAQIGFCNVVEGVSIQ